ncbi:septal ring lytic transglycosylase RlpA family protein [Nitrosomonas sp. HPC101]|uniref:septal ring lytic transglycosylase RlpA family protein n=1 Tax=Nitrosomonas sp. HPC101 TaxID=1658667 RepID=UPI0023DB41B9|nr:septal ring lytic transglycosylase RlpA family protein [Nitrosomonas sp. HPC101]
MHAKNVSTAGSRGGGYYLDDGPEANPPANLDSVPDAVPRAESLKTATMRPYVALGKTYTPMAALKPYKERGQASWYGKRYHGQRTASGDVYDMYSMTAAHPTLPIPSYARVTNLQNGRSVVVRINDRGPFLGSRLIDLSYVAAYKLGILANGRGRVEVESITPDRFSGSYPAATQSQPDMNPERGSDNNAGKFYLQLAAFGSAHNARSYLTQLRSDFPSITQQTHINQTEGLHKIFVGPFSDREAAIRTANAIIVSGSSKPILVPDMHIAGSE